MKMTLFEKYFTFGTTRGERVPVLTEKINVSALYKRHAKSGFVILSANLSNKDPEYNNPVLNFSSVLRSRASA